MTPLDLVVRSRTVVTPGGTLPAAVCVRDGVIAAVERYDARPDARRDVDLGDDTLLPGLVDTHVHVNEPGRTEWEGFATATRAAAAGGVTTIVDMPLNSVPPTVSVEALTAKRAAATGQAHVDIGFWGGVVPGNVGQLAPLHRAGVFGFKCFLAPSGVEEFPHCTADQLEAAARELRRLEAPLIVHAEDARVLDDAPPAHGPRYADFLASRPGRAEDLAVAALIELSDRLGVRVHVLHLSSAEAVARLAAARFRGVPISAETCPHYLVFAAEDVPDAATAYKCCPPIRDADNRDDLWRALRDGVIGCVVSDHSPCPPQLKRRGNGDFGLAWGGISSLQLGLAAVWTEARRRGHPLADVVSWMGTAPARLVGVAGKGALAEGYDADLVAFAPDETFTVDPARLQHRHPVTPYEGRRLTGVVRATWLRGTEVFGPVAGVSGAEIREPPHGRLLTPSSLP